MKIPTTNLDILQMRNGKVITKRMPIPNTVYPIARSFVTSGMMMRDFGENSITLEDGRIVTVEEPEQTKQTKKKGEKDAE